MATTTDTAVTTDATVPTTQQAVPTLPQDSRLIGNGPSGFLTTSYTAGGGDYWTSYKDGVTTELPLGAYPDSVRSDTVVKESLYGHSYTLYDKATDAPPVVIDLAFLGTSAYLKGVAGNTLVVHVPRADGSSELHLVSKPDGTIVDRTISGLPTDVRYFSCNADSPDALTLLYTGTVNGVSGTRIARVDVTTATVVEDRPAPNAGLKTDVAMSATHLVWAEQPAADGAVALGVAKWGEPGFTRLPLGYASRLDVELMGDWITYAETGGRSASYRNPLHALTARSLTTGRTVKVLDTVLRIRSQSDDELLVQGGTIEHGEGFYRIAPGPDGTPVATFVASTGTPTALGLVSEEVPVTADFGKADSKVRFSWQFGRSGTKALVELTHTASGKRWTSQPAFLDNDRRAFVDWTGLFDNGTAAYNGTYTWKMTASPFNGIGPAVVRTGTLKVASKAAPHDYSDSGTPDLLVRDSAGRLSSYDARQMLFPRESWEEWEQTDRGGGWNVYNKLIAPGNLAGTGYADVLARDRSGNLWFFQGNAHSLAPRTWVGGGWGIYHQIAAGSDLTGDGRPDLVAADTSGALWLHKATGIPKTPFAPRTKIGSGWGIYTKVTATGNIGGGPAGDIVGRDKAGVLWLHLGKGDGTFAPRTRIGGGWNAFTDLVGIGDTDRDGRPDLIAVNGMGGTTDSMALYKGTGDWRAPFGARTTINSQIDLQANAAVVF